jgi:PAS domain S-box-containing protein
MEVTLFRKEVKSQTRGRKLHRTEAKARIARARKTRAELEQELKACRREIAHARERLAEATMQQTATSEMLRLISNSPIQSVLDAVAEHAAHLCDASNARIWRLEDNRLRLVASYGENSATMDGREGLPADRDTVTGRAACDRRTIHVHDIAFEVSEYPLGSRIVKDQGWRTTLATPLLREGTPIGTILVRRMEVRPFYDQQIALLETFAGQAAIAIENVRLLEAEKQRTLALAQANHDLAEREAKIQRLVDSNIIGIFIWDFDGRILEANDEFLGMVSYDREDLVSGRIRWADLTPPDWRDRNNARIERQKGGGRFEPFEKEFTRKDGSRVPILLGGATFEEGGNQGIAYVLDLTEPKRAEGALRESEAKFRDYAATASDWLWEIGRDYKFTLLTENAFHSDPADRIGTLCWDHALDLETEPEKWRLVWATLDSRKPFRDFVYCSVDGSGAPMYVKVSGKPVFDANGEFRGYRGTGTDVTALRTMEAEARENERRYREAQLELAHANRVATMGQLTASITHEVNQPITAAVTYALAARRFLSAEPPNFHEVDDALSLIVKEGNRAGEVVGRIRALIKKAPARKDAVEINEAILEVIALTRTEAANNSVSVRTQLAEGLPRVQGDRVQLQQVLLNLIINAIEAMRDISEKERELLISSRNEPDGVSVEVRDSGPGFALADIDRVFEAFYSTKSSGLGLGLSICRSIIEAHNGRLWASPNVPRGAIFGFIAPAHPAAAS